MKPQNRRRIQKRNRNPKEERRREKNKVIDHKSNLKLIIITKIFTLDYKIT